MDSSSRFCTECGRSILGSRGSTVCPMCEQASLDTTEAFEASSDQPAQPAVAPANPLAQASVPQYAGLVPPPPLDTPRAAVIPHEVQREISSIASMELATAIVWLIIGILQVLALVTAFVGIWNIVVSTSRFRRKREIEQLNPGVPRTVQGELGWIIFFIVLNLFLGGIIGVAGAVMDIFIRERILKVRWAFEQSSVAGVSLPQRNPQQLSR